MQKSTTSAGGNSVAQAIDREVVNVVRLYDFSADAPVSLLSESENKVYLIRDPELEKDHVVRVNSGRLSYHSAPSIASEMMWLMALRRETDIVVPQVLKARDGSTVQTMTAGFGPTASRSRLQLPAGCGTFRGPVAVRVRAAWRDFRPDAFACQGLEARPRL